VELPERSARPGLTPGLTGAEFLRWYWVKDELVGFARDLGVRATGSKDVLTRRIAAALDGVAFEEPPSRRVSGAQLAGELRASTVIPPGQRCSQRLRAWFEAHLGTGFSFDAPMRAFLAEADGVRTLGDALAHYRATRGERAGIGSQFEFNRFTGSSQIGVDQGSEPACFE